MRSGGGVLEVEVDIVERAPGWRWWFRAARRFTIDWEEAWRITGEPAKVDDGLG